MKKIILLLCLCFSSIVNAEFRHFHNWTESEKLEFIAFTTLSAVDYNQTEWALEQKTPAGRYVFVEMNPIYGKRPKDQHLILGQLVGIASYYTLIGMADDTNNSKLCRGILMGIKIAVVYHNNAVGISMSKAL